MEQCPRCGGRLLVCFCDGFTVSKVPDEERLPWIGEWPGTQECREFDWFTDNAESVPGWFRTGDVRQPIPDFNRLHRQACWSRTERRFIEGGTGR